MLSQGASQLSHALALTLTGFPLTPVEGWAPGAPHTASTSGGGGGGGGDEGSEDDELLMGVRSEGRGEGRDERAVPPAYKVS